MTSVYLKLRGEGQRCGAALAMIDLSGVANDVECCPKRASPHWLGRRLLDSENIGASPHLSLTRVEYGKVGIFLDGLADRDL